MKRLIAAVCASMIFLCACGSETTYMNTYTVVTSSKTSDIASMLQIDTGDGFASDLGVITAEDSENGVNSETLSQISAQEILLVGKSDATIITASNIYTQMAPASTTKILTALTALKYAEDLDAEITLTEEMYVTESDAQVCGFEAGDVVTLRTLLYVMLVYSGNDAANAVACAVGGSISAFCDMMNAEAKALGATHTNFVTPHGLDDSSHYTTAYDLYLIFNECLKYDVFVDAISQSEFTVNYIRNGENCSRTYQSTNYYLRGYQQAPEGVIVIGGKTGTTSNAGCCLILYAQNTAGEDYIAVLLGVIDRTTLYNNMTK